MKISDCQAFSPFKTLPGCQAFRHSVFVLFCRVSFHDENFTLAKIFSASSLTREGELEMIAFITRKFLFS